MLAMRPWLSARRTWSVLLVLCAAVGVARAVDPDPPGRAARLAGAEGGVSLQPAGVQEWTVATLNRPLTTGDRLWSDQSSRAELDLGTAGIRLGSNTGLAFLNLDDRSAQMQLSAGALIVSVRDLQSGESYEIDTPNIALSLQQPGVYRIEVNDEGTATAVAVSAGAAQASGSGETVAIGAQQVVTFTGTNTLAWSSATLDAPDDFDNWSAERERELADSASAPYVANDVPGTQDLDNYGHWEQASEYGPVWVPTAVAVGWVPYRYGHWLWVTPWGWTWVDDARWGYAPFHYGRWVVWNNSWCWVPAPRHGRLGRTIYAPALVAWVGGPAVVASGNNVGWFPLGPREVFVPAYHASLTYVRNVNITNTSTVSHSYVTNVYQNDGGVQHYMNETPGAVTAVPRNTFASGQRVGGQVMPLSSSLLAAAAVVAAAPAIVPTRQSVLGPGESARVARPPDALLLRSVVARSPPPAAPAPFGRQLAALQEKGGRPLTRGELAVLQPATPLAPVRVVTSRASATVSGGAVTRSAAGTRTPASLPPSLAERERTLQQSILPAAAPRAHLPARRAPEMSVYAPPEVDPSWSAPALRSDRPSSAQQHAAPRETVPDDAGQAADTPLSMPVYHFPSAGDAPAHPASTAHSQDTNRVPPPPPVPHTATLVPPPLPVPHTATPVPPPLPVPHTATPVPPPPPVPHTVTPVPPLPPAHPPSARTQSSQDEPRDSAPHGDRDSRERVLR
jgi:hypothetical protein